MKQKTCEVCGRDVHGEENIKDELKELLTRYYRQYNVKTMGHPLFFILAGDAGSDIVTSPFIHPPRFMEDDTHHIFLELLREIYLDANKDPKTAFGIEWSD
jgi:hypothetical protein